MRRRTQGISALIFWGIHPGENQPLPAALHSHMACVIALGCLGAQWRQAKTHLAGSAGRYMHPYLSNMVF